MKMDILAKVPAEISELILSYLSAKDLATASFVCRSWRQLCNSDYLWKRLCFRNGYCDQLLASNFKSVKGAQTLWSQLFNAHAKREQNWNTDACVTLTQDGTAAFIHGFFIIVGSESELSINHVENGNLVPLQAIPTQIATTRISARGDTIVFGNDVFLSVYKFNDGLYQKEVILHPFDSAIVEKTDSTTLDNISYKICVITENFVWVGIVITHVMALCKIYNRSEKNFCDINLSDLVSIFHNDKYVVVLRPNAIQIYSASGQLWCRLDQCSFYTGLSISSNGVAFLQSQDFCDPEAVYYDFKLEKCYIEIELKVYKLTLYEDNLLFLTGVNNFALVSQRDGKNLWTTELSGSKYLRPGRDLFEVVCSKFIFVSPSMCRMDRFSLYDLQSGLHLYSASTLNMSSFHLLQVRDSGLLYKKDNQPIKIRSYI